MNFLKKTLFIGTESIREILNMLSFIQTTSNIGIFISDMIDTYIRPLDMKDNIFRISLMLSVDVYKRQGVHFWASWD